MKKITLTKDQERLLKQEAEKEVEQDGEVAHTTYNRTEKEIDILNGLMDDMDRLLEELGPEEEKILETKYGYDLWKWYYAKYKNQK